MNETFAIDVEPYGFPPLFIAFQILSMKALARMIPDTTRTCRGHFLVSEPKTIPCLHRCAFLDLTKSRGRVVHACSRAALPRAIADASHCLEEKKFFCNVNNWNWLMSVSKYSHLQEKNRTSFLQVFKERSKRWFLFPRLCIYTIRNSQ